MVADSAAQPRLPGAGEGAGGLGQEPIAPARVGRFETLTVDATSPGRTIGPVEEHRRPLRRSVWARAAGVKNTDSDR